MFQTVVNLATGETSLVALTAEEIMEREASAAEAARVTPRMINDERDRRIDAGFLFKNKVIQFDASSQANILGACQLAAMNALPEGFVWITIDNSLLSLDGAGVIAMGQAGAAFKSRIIFAARALKDRDPIPADYATNETYWA